MSRGEPKVPPANLNTRSLDAQVRSLSGVFWRLSLRGSARVDWSDRAGGRFSNPALPCRVFYFASLKSTALWERFGDDLLDQDGSTRAISEPLLAARVWKTVLVGPGLRVLNLTDAAALRTIGADGATFSAHYECTQRWAAGLMAHPAAIDGVIYASRLNPPKKCVALFERPHSAASLKVQVRAPAPIDDPVILALLAKERIRLM